MEDIGKIIMVVLAFMLLIPFVNSQGGGSTVTNIYTTQNQPWKYTIYKNSTQYYARNEVTGALTHNANLATLHNGIASACTITLKEGNYTITSALTLAEGETLQGQGSATVINADANINAITATTRTHCTVKDLKIDMHSKTGHGVVFSGSSQYCRAENLRIVNVANFGIYIYQSQYCSVLNNECVGGQIGIAVESIDATSPAAYNLIQGNKCLGNSLGTSQAAIHFEGICSYNKVLDNYCVNNTGTYGHGIMLLSSSSQGSYYNQVSGNTCIGNTYNGIRIQHQRYMTISDNNCRGNGNSGIALTADAMWDNGYNTIEGNTCISNGAYGINCEYAAMQHSIVLGNICISNTSGQINGFGGTDTVASNIVA